MGTKKEEKEVKEEKEKIPLGESIGHRPLRGCCPKREEFRNRRIMNNEKDEQA